MENVLYDKSTLHDFFLEIESLKNKMMAGVDERDLIYIKKIRKISDLMNISSKITLSLSILPINPLWAIGVILQYMHLMLENSELGHNILHGQYDKLCDEKYNSKNWNWVSPIEEESWKREHNAIHHTYTNTVGKDPDFGYTYFRGNKETPWSPVHLFQVINSLLTMPFFRYIIALYAAGAFDNNPACRTNVAGKLTEKERKRLKNKCLKKILTFIFKKHIASSFLSGPFFGNYLFGVLIAELMTNIHLQCIIYCGHLPDYVDSFTKMPKNSEEFLLHQVLGTSNVKCSKFASILNGGLDKQIEHHLFPQLPPNKLREVAPKVKEICEKFNIPYREDTFPKQISRVYKRLIKFSFPI